MIFYIFTFFGFSFFLCNIRKSTNNIVTSLIAFRWVEYGPFLIHGHNFGELVSPIHGEKYKTFLSIARHTREISLLLVHPAANLRNRCLFKAEFFAEFRDVMEKRPVDALNFNLIQEIPLHSQELQVDHFSSWKSKQNKLHRSRRPLKSL